VSKIPENYVINKLFSYAYEPVFRKHDSTYNAGCPVCKEGKSLGKKKRLFYYPKSNTFHCFNCTRTWTAYSWIMKVGNLSKEEIDYEISTNNFSVDVEVKKTPTRNKPREIPDLPYDSINIFDLVQQQYYKKSKEFNDVLEYAISRRLDRVINKSSVLYVSLTDVVHKNRLVIPFYDRNNKIVFYQTRAIDRSEPRYLGKVGYDKTVFGIERIDNQIPYIFMFEGPIDAMHVRNGVAVAGLTLTEKQNIQLAEFPFHQKIWVLDNPKFDEAADKKIKQLLQNGERVFKWKAGMSYKDLNEMAMFEDMDEISYQVILDSLY
jgi:DNA primase